MSKIDEVTFGDLRRSFVRYRPFIAVVASIAALMIVLPGRGGGGAGGTAAGDDVTPYAQTGASAEGGDGDVAAGGGGEGTSGGATAGRAGTTSTGSGASGSGASGGGSGGGGGTTGGQSAATRGSAQGMVDNCDPSTGRIKIPTRFAPICVPKHSGDNGGATYRGITGDSIKVVYFKIAEDAATNAILSAANANDSDEQEFQQVRDWITFYESHFQMYGRKIDLEILRASGSATDSAAGRADAIKAIDTGAFAVWNASNNTMVDELVARGVMCFCTVSQPVETYLRWAPHVWSTLMASSQGYLHRAEYIGKRLKAGKAQWAGDPVFQQTERKFGIIYYDTDDKSYKPGLDFFVKHLKEQYGITPAVVAEYHGYPETHRSQEEARPLVQKLVQAGVTSVVCVCDPFGPIFFTQESTRQAYQPEWIITGSALTDTSFFARLYDPVQWQHAFGISFLPGRLPEELSDSFRLLKWHFDPNNADYEPSAPAGYGVIRGPIDLFFHGVHLAGPNLTPRSIEAGMFAAPPAGENSITAVQVSFGEKGFWPWPDHLAFDDVTEIWWDPAAEGEDEIGSNGRGLYRYVDMGIRYLPGKHPSSPPKAFDPANTATIYEEPPPQDQWPEYPSPNG